MDTLALMLKVKDDPMLMQHWIEYHSAIVGDRNLTILDCGSEDLAQIQLLKEWENRFHIIHYDEYYDNIHATNNNVEIFREFCSTADYVSILDADEYIFGIGGGVVSAGQVIDILKSNDADIYAGTWFWNTRPPAEQDGAIDWSVPIEFGLDAPLIQAGTVAGKSIVRGALVSDIHHLGHNLHVKEVVARMTRRSFGRIGIFHLQNLSVGLNRMRTIKHLKARRVVPQEIDSDHEIISFLRKGLDQGTVSPINRVYAERYIGEGSALNSGTVFEAAVSIGLPPQRDTEFLAAIGSFNFDAVLAAARVQFDLA